MKLAVQPARFALSCSGTNAEIDMNGIPRFLHLVCAKQIRDTNQSLFCSDVLLCQNLSQLLST